MYIGEVSKRTGLSVKAIRFYEERGLIAKPKRLGRYRTYQESDIELLVLIKEAKQLGVTLSQLKDIIVYKNEKVDWQRVQVFLSQVRLQLLEQITEIKRKIKKIDECCEQINS